VVRLLLFRCADIARYCLPDHRISPSPHSSFCGFGDSNQSPKLCPATNLGPQLQAIADSVEENSKSLSSISSLQGAKV
jgi:hypothetical protein